MRIPQKEVCQSSHNPAPVAAGCHSSGDPDDEADTAGKSISGGMGQMPPAAVIVTTVELEKTRERIKATGFLKALSRSDIGTKTGADLEMPVDEGDEVQKGDTLTSGRATRLAQIVEGKARLTTAAICYFNARRSFRHSLIMK